MFCQHFIKRISSCCHLYIVLCHFNIVKALLFTITFHARHRKVGANGWTVHREAHSNRRKHSWAKHFFSVASLLLYNPEDKCLFKPGIGSNWPIFRPRPSLYVVSMVSTQVASHMAGQQGTLSYKLTPTNLYTSAITPLSRLQLGRLRWS